VRALLCRAFRDGKFMTLEAASCQEAFTLALERGPALIVLDLVLPDGNGLEVLRSLRARSCRASVLILSALGTTQDRVTGLRAGSDDYLQKPFDTEELMARADVLIRRFYHASDACIRIGNLVLDPISHQATWGEAAIPLTQREFELLYFLMRNPDRIHSRDDLLQAVWGSAEYATSIVGVYVNYVRRKLLNVRAGVVVETVPGGAGYTIRSERAGE